MLPVALRQSRIAFRASLLDAHFCPKISCLRVLRRLVTVATRDVRRLATRRKSRNASKNQLNTTVSESNSIKSQNLNYAGRVAKWLMSLREVADWREAMNDLRMRSERLNRHLKENPDQEFDPPTDKEQRQELEYELETILLDLLESLDMLVKSPSPPLILRQIREEIPV
jgi:hypothetical protein